MVPSIRVKDILRFATNSIASQIERGSREYVAPLSTRNFTVSCFPVGPVTKPSIYVIPVFQLRSFLSSVSLKVKKSKISYDEFSVLHII